jgi:hypothetical protein
MVDQSDLFAARVFLSCGPWKQQSLDIFRKIPKDEKNHPLLL